MKALVYLLLLIVLISLCTAISGMPPMYFLIKEVHPCDVNSSLIVSNDTIRYDQTVNLTFNTEIRCARENITFLEQTITIYVEDINQPNLPPIEGLSRNITGETNFHINLSYSPKRRGDLFITYTQEITYLNNSSKSIIGPLPKTNQIYLKSLSPDEYDVWVNTGQIPTIAQTVKNESEEIKRELKEIKENVTEITGKINVSESKKYLEILLPITSSIAFSLLCVYLSLPKTRKEKKILYCSIAFLIISMIFLILYLL